MGTDRKMMSRFIFFALAGVAFFGLAVETQPVYPLLHLFGRGVVVGTAAAFVVIGVAKRRWPEGKL